MIDVMTGATLGILVIKPAFGHWLKTLLDGFYDLFHLESSIIPASLLANDMGGTSIALEVARDSGVGAFNAFVVSSMPGCIVSFTIPFAIGVVHPSQHKELFSGLLCGISTVPVGCIVAGFVCGLTFLEILVDLLPLTRLGLIKNRDRSRIYRGISFNPCFQCSDSESYGKNESKRSCSEHRFCSFCCLYVVGSHLAFTMAYDETYAIPMIIGKLVSVVSAVALALLLHNKRKKTWYNG